MKVALTNLSDCRLFNHHPGTKLIRDFRAMSFLEDDDSPWQKQPSLSLGIDTTQDAATVSPWGHAESDEDIQTVEAFKTQDSKPQSFAIGLSDSRVGKSDPMAVLTAPVNPTSDLVFKPRPREDDVYTDEDKGSISKGTENAGAQIFQATDANLGLRAGPYMTVRRERVTIDLQAESDPLGASAVKAGDTCVRAGSNVPIDDEFSDVSVITATTDDQVHNAMTAMKLKEPEGKAQAGHRNQRQDFSASKDIVSHLLPPDDVRFEINLSNPEKSGEGGKSFTLYTIHMKTNFENFKVHSATVQRRYRDFRWLYRALELNHIGYVVPPPPEKQAVGRFSENFVENRMAALEQMLRRIVKHPVLRQDADLEAFLTSENFSEYMKQRVISDEELDRNTSQGIIGSIGGAIIGKSQEPDAWTLEQRMHLDQMELQLKAIHRALSTVIAQRNDLSNAMSEFANASNALANIEPTRRLGDVLRAFAKVHQEIAEIYARQRLQDAVSFERTVDEYLRTVGSMREAINARERVQGQAASSAAQLSRKRAALEKLQTQGKTQQARQSALEEEIEALVKKTNELQQLATETSQHAKEEVARVDAEKFVDFRNAVELVLENAVETQKQTIELWETFYDRNFAKCERASQQS